MPKRAYPFYSVKLGHEVCSKTEHLFFTHLQAQGYAHYWDPEEFREAVGKAYTTNTGVWPVNGKIYNPDAFLKTANGKFHVLELKTESGRALGPQNKKKYREFVENYVKPQENPLAETVGFRAQFNNSPVRFHWISYKTFAGKPRGWLARLLK